MARVTLWASSSLRYFKHSGQVRSFPEQARHLTVGSSLVFVAAANADAHEVLPSVGSHSFCSGDRQRTRGEFLSQTSLLENQVAAF